MTSFRADPTGANDDFGIISEFRHSILCDVIVSLSNDECRCEFRIQLKKGGSTENFLTIRKSEKNCSFEKVSEKSSHMTIIKSEM